MEMNCIIRTDLNKKLQQSHPIHIFTYTHTYLYFVVANK